MVNKRILILLILSFLTTGCKKNQNLEDYNMDGQVNNVAFFFFYISDDTGLEKEKIYKIKANVTDSFSFSMDNLFVTATFFDKNEKCSIIEIVQYDMRH